MSVYDNYDFDVRDITAVENILREAENAGRLAYEACTPHPVIFGQAVGLTGNAMVPGTEELCTEGACGFAWVSLSKGQTRLVNKLKKLGIGSRSVYGSWYIWAPGMSQSIDRKEAWAEAFTDVLRKHGIKAYAQSRLD